MRRKTTAKRRTRETKVRVTVDLDGSGRYDVRLGEPFAKHMLESLARFARFDMTVDAGGDMDHHVVEDAAITLGRAFREALRNRPVQRVGWAVVPMDEALVLVAVDLIDRPLCDVELPGEMEMCEHMLRSFAMESGITLHNAVLKGRNAHHIAEATFKALGLALQQATRPAEALRSTKSRVKWR
jgi:imidazoleglycerol-phosphate dehydratase